MDSRVNFINTVFAGILLSCHMDEGQLGVEDLCCDYNPGNLDPSLVVSVRIWLTSTTDCTNPTPYK